MMTYIDCLYLNFDPLCDPNDVDGSTGSRSVSVFSGLSLKPGFFSGEMERNLEGSRLVCRPVVDSRLKEERGTGQVDLQMRWNTGSLHRLIGFRAETDGHRSAIPIERRAVAVIGQQLDLYLAGMLAVCGLISSRSVGRRLKSTR